MTSTPAPIVIKKYANRRLYNTATSSYVTLDHLSQMVKDNTDFVVYDAKTGEDITRAALTQIIVDEESKGGQNLLPISFLRQLISFYGDSLGGLVPRYLEYSMQAFLKNEQQMRNYMETALGGMLPFNPIEEMNKQNIQLFANAIKMFAPFFKMPGGPQQQPQATNLAETAVQELQDRLAALQKRINELSDDKK